MIAKDIILNFEKVLKQNKAINISKTKEKDYSNWKLIYDLEGFIYNNFYIPYVKIVFFMNTEMTEFNEKSFLVGDGLNFEVYELEHIEDMFNSIIENKTIIKFSNFVINGINELNKLTDDPFVALEQKMDENGVISMQEKYLFFVVSRIDSDYHFVIKANMTILEIEGETFKLNKLEDAYKYVVEKIDNKK